jgi:tRNA threonylcarbamoyladenosine biosynthesis protein TsaE
MTERYLSSTPEDTFEIGKSLGKRISQSCVIAFFGELGAGKTTLIRGLVEGAGAGHAREVCSPTFNYMNAYTSGQQHVYHFDLYRLKSASEFVSAGFYEYLEAKGICCIEWSERIETLFETFSMAIPLVKIAISHQGETLREIEIVGLNS